MNCCKLCLYHTRDTPALERKESEAGFPCGPEFLVPLADVQTGQALPEARARQGWGAMVQLPSLLWGAVLLLLQCESASCRCQDSPGMGGLLAKVLCALLPALTSACRGQRRGTPLDLGWLGWTQPGISSRTFPIYQPFPSFPGSKSAVCPHHPVLLSAVREVSVGPQREHVALG